MFEKPPITKKKPKAAVHLSQDHQNMRRYLQNGGAMDQSSAQLHFPKITSPNLGNSTKIDKAQISGRGKEGHHQRPTHQIVNSNLRDRSIDLKNTYGGLSQIESPKGNNKYN